MSKVRAGVALLGPAFVAAIAYVDPGNVATNTAAGARFGYLLVWVVVVANAMAGLVQYLSAKLGLVTGLSLPEAIRSRLPTGYRLAYWAQAEVVAMATDLAEVLGGALALNLLFGLPLALGGLITGAVATGLLLVRDRAGQRPFERVITGLLLVIAIGFAAGLFVSAPSGAGLVGGLVPRFNGPESLLLAAGMLGATVMPHAVYLHSALARDRHSVPTRSVEPRTNGPFARIAPGQTPSDSTINGRLGRGRPPGEGGGCPAGAGCSEGVGCSASAGRSESGRSLRRLLLATRFDVGIAMVFAGAVNLAMLLLAATALTGTEGVDTLPAVHAAVSDHLGTAIALLFAVGLLASGFASSSVGVYAGAVIMGGLLRRKVPLLARRLFTLVPALVLLGAGVNPTWALVISQVVLSFGIPFALIPLVSLTAKKSVMGAYANTKTTTVLAVLVAVAVIVLNVALIYLTVSG